MCLLCPCPAAVGRKFCQTPLTRLWILCPLFPLFKTDLISVLQAVPSLLLLSLFKLQAHRHDKISACADTEQNNDQHKAIPSFATKSLSRSAIVIQHAVASSHVLLLMLHQLYSIFNQSSLLSCCLYSLFTGPLALIKKRAPWGFDTVSNTSAFSPFTFPSLAFSLCLWTCLQPCVHMKIQRRKPSPTYSPCEPPSSSLSRFTPRTNSDQWGDLLRKANAC